MNITFFYTETRDRPTKTSPLAREVKVVKFFTWKSSFDEPPPFLGALTPGSHVVLRSPWPTGAGKCWEVLHVYIAPQYVETFVHVKLRDEVANNPVLQQLFGGGADAE